MIRPEIKRTMGPDDIAEIDALLTSTARFDGRPALSDHLLLDVMSGGQPGFAGLVFRSPDHERPIAYAQISAGNDSSVFEVVIDPERRSDTTTITRTAIENAVAVVRADGGGELHWWVQEPTDTHRRLADEAGLSPSRTLFQMRRTLPADRHATIDTRSFVPGDDDAEWIRVNNRAFADHGEQGGWTIDTLRQRQNESWFDPDGFRIHERDGRMAGFCWTKVHPDGSESESDALGEIYVIAVDPDFHGLGLGSEMTLAGLDHLAATGITIALLYVDGDNLGAIALYRKLGFAVHSTNAAFSANVS